MKTFLLFVIAIIFLGAGVAIRLWIGKRRFERRNAAGHQQFTSYRKAVVVPRMENLIFFFYILFVMIGLVLLLIAFLYANGHGREYVNYFL